MKKITPIEQNPIVIVRRKLSSNNYHHGGSWKIAYADFVTSMMAFFLVMWLVNVTDDKAKDSIANYFNPIKLVKNSKGKKGLNKVHNSLSSETNSPKYKDNEGADGNKNKKLQIVATKTQEAEMLADPFLVIDQVIDGPSADRKENTTLDIDGFSKNYTNFLSDDPNYEERQNRDKQVDKFINSLYIESLKTPPKPKNIEEVIKRAQAKLNAKKLLVGANKLDITEQNKNHDEFESKSEQQESLKKDVNSEDLSTAENKSAKTPQKMAEELRYLFAKKDGESSPNVEIKADQQGLRIILSDNKDFGLFNVGSAKPNKETVKVLEQIAKTLNNKKVKIIINGHTDARPYRSHSYDNWQLSTSRAQMTYYMLLRGGLDKKLVDHIGGYADSQLQNTIDPYAAENRRIEILVLPNKAALNADINYDQLDKISMVTVKQSIIV